jgi:hypothetical protein
MASPDAWSRTNIGVPHHSGSALETFSRADQAAGGIAPCGTIGSQGLGELLVGKVPDEDRHPEHAEVLLPCFE